MKKKKMILIFILSLLLLLLVLGRYIYKKNKNIEIYEYVEDKNIEIYEYVEDLDGDGITENIKIIENFEEFKYESGIEYDTHISGYSKYKIYINEMKVDTIKVGGRSVSIEEFDEDYKGKEIVFSYSYVSFGKGYSCEEVYKYNGKKLEKIHDFVEPADFKFFNMLLSSNMASWLELEEDEVEPEKLEDVYDLLADFKDIKIFLPKGNTIENEYNYIYIYNTKFDKAEERLAQRVRKETYRVISEENKNLSKFNIEYIQKVSITGSTEETKAIVIKLQNAEKYIYYIRNY